MAARNAGKANAPVFRPGGGLPTGDRLRATGSPNCLTATDASGNTQVFNVASIATLLGCTVIR